jgi:hypothetical protein
MSRASVAALRELNNFRVTRAHPYKVGTDIDWSRPVYRLRPKGFETILATIIVDEEPGHKTDIERFFDNVKVVAETPAPKLHSRKKGKR